MDDLKLLRRKENELKNEMKIVQTISKDIKMNLMFIGPCIVLTVE